MAAADSRVLLVGEDATRVDRVAAALAEASEVLAVETATATSEIQDGGTIDGVDGFVVVGDPGAVSVPEPGGRPLVVFADADPGTVRESLPAATGHVRPREDLEVAAGHLADRLGWSLAAEPSRGEPPGDLLDHVVDGALVVDAAGTVRWYNATVVETLGVDPDVFVGRPLAALAEAGPLSADGVANMERALDRLEAGESRSETVEVDAALPGRGEQVLEVKCSPLPAAAGGGAVATVRNVTGRHEMATGLRESRTKIERLHEIAAEMVACTTPEEVYELTVDAAERILEFDLCGVDVVEDGWFVPKALSAGVENVGYKSMPATEGVGGRTYQSGESIVVDDVTELEGEEPADESYRSVLSVPIGTVGVFQAAAREPEGFDDDDVRLAELLMAHVRETLARISVETALRERRRTFERLHESTAGIVGCRDADELFERTIDAAGEIFQFEVSLCYLADGTELEIRATSADAPMAVGHRTSVNSGVVGRTYRHGESQLVIDGRQEPDADPYRESYRSAVSIPIGDQGVFQAISTEVGAYDHHDLALAELLVSHAAAALDRVQVEAALREREGELVAERDRLAALFENVPDAAVRFSYVDGEPIARAVNPAFEAVFGYDADTVVGENLDAFLIPEDVALRPEAVNERMRAGESHHLEGTRLTAEGPREFLIHVVPDQTHETPAGYVIYTDITERKEREAALERKNERLAEFASIVSHDLRSPLSVARGFLELGRESGDDADFEKVASAHERMDTLIDELLTLAREGTDLGTVERVELGQAAAEAWATVAAAEASIDIRAETVIEADASRVVQLFENLFRNAIDHVESPVSVVVGELEAEPGFFVADDGPGIPPDEREAVFETGYTTATDGTGFGLAIVSRVVQAHGWDVRVVEGEAGGARFEILTDVD